MTESTQEKFSQEEVMMLFARAIMFLLDDETGICIRNDTDGKNYVVFRSGAMINITEEAQSLPEGLKVKITKE